MPANNFGPDSEYLPTPYAERIISYENYYDYDEGFESLEEYEDYINELASEPGTIFLEDLEDLENKIETFSDSLQIFTINIRAGYYDGFQIVTEFDNYDFFYNEPDFDDACWYGYDSIEELEEAIAEEFLKIKIFLKKLTKEYNLKKYIPKK